MTPQRKDQDAMTDKTAWHHRVMHTPIFSNEQIDHVASVADVSREAVIKAAKAMNEERAWRGEVWSELHDELTSWAGDELIKRLQGPDDPHVVQFHNPQQGKNWGATGGQLTFRNARKAKRWLHRYLRDAMQGGLGSFEGWRQDAETANFHLSGWWGGEFSRAPGIKVTRQKDA